MPHPLGRTREGSDQSGHGSLRGTKATVDVSIRKDILLYRNHSSSAVCGFGKLAGYLLVYYGK
jgi:hypothetical protein